MYAGFLYPIKQNPYMEFMQEFMRQLSCCLNSFKSRKYFVF